MNGGKDVKFGDDKRPVSIVPSNEQNLYNISNGELLTDEFGNPLITEVDTYYLPDATAKRSTSVVVPTKESAFSRPIYVSRGSATVQYADLDVHVLTNVLRRSGSPNPVTVGLTVLEADGGTVNLDQHPRMEVRVRDSLLNRKDELYGTIPAAVSVGDLISGPFITPGTFVSEIGYNNTRLYMSENYSAEENYVGVVSFFTAARVVNKHDPIIKVEEQFKETSEVSNTLLGVNRAEVQLSLFSNVSSYGLDPDEFETFSWTSGTSFGSWDSRYSKLYGENRYNTKESEETEESAIRIGSFSVPYSFPFGPKFEKLGLYNADLFQRYINFSDLGNDLHEYYNGPAGTPYPDSWKKSFLNPGDVYVNPSGFGGKEVEYEVGVVSSFARIDTWTETFRDIIAKSRRDPVTNLTFGFEDVQELILPGTSDKFLTEYPTSGDIRPGYSSTHAIYTLLQSRRTFRYQPGRISGFTFGVRASTESNSGYITEWGIGNPTDHYVFRISKGNLSIVRRSTVPLGSVALARSGLTLSDQTPQTSGNRFDIDPAPIPI